MSALLEPPALIEIPSTTPPHLTPLQAALRAVGVGRRGSRSLSDEELAGLRDSLELARTPVTAKGAFLAGLCAKGISPAEREWLLFHLQSTLNSEEMLRWERVLTASAKTTTATATTATKSAPAENETTDEEREKQKLFFAWLFLEDSKTSERILSSLEDLVPSEKSATNKIHLQANTLFKILLTLIAGRTLSFAESQFIGAFLLADTDAAWLTGVGSPQGMDIRSTIDKKAGDDRNNKYGQNNKHDPNNKYDKNNKSNKSDESDKDRVDETQSLSASKFTPGGEFIRGFVLNTLRVRYETATEWAGLYVALSKTIRPLAFPSKDDNAFARAEGTTAAKESTVDVPVETTVASAETTTTVASTETTVTSSSTETGAASAEVASIGEGSGVDPVVVFAEPMNGFTRSAFISPLLAWWVEQYWGGETCAVHLESANPGPKYGFNFRDLATTLKMPFLPLSTNFPQSPPFQDLENNSRRTKEAETTAEVEAMAEVETTVEAIGDAIEDAIGGSTFGRRAPLEWLSPELGDWVIRRRAMIKRPAWATLEKFVFPLPRERDSGGVKVPFILITSAFHGPYLAKMCTLARFAGFDGYIIAQWGMEGGLGASLSRPIKLVAGKRVAEDATSRNRVAGESIARERMDAILEGGSHAGIEDGNGNGDREGYEERTFTYSTRDIGFPRVRDQLGVPVESAEENAKLIRGWLASNATVNVEAWLDGHLADPDHADLGSEDSRDPLSGNGNRLDRLDSEGLFAARVKLSLLAYSRALQWIQLPPRDDE